MLTYLPYTAAVHLRHNYTHGLRRRRWRGRFGSSESRVRRPLNTLLPRWERSRGHLPTATRRRVDVMRTVKNGDGVWTTQLTDSYEIWSHLMCSWLHDAVCLHALKTEWMHRWRFANSLISNDRKFSTADRTLWLYTQATHYELQDSLHLRLIEILVISCVQWLYTATVH